MRSTGRKTARETVARGDSQARDDAMVCVRDATEHNLRGVDVDIPRDRLVAFTGVSGSGKSSLAFGTIFSASQQRYLESISPYARRLIDQGSAPRVGEISGLPPAVALRQTYGGASSRSTVGTVSHVSNVLRMLYSRAGTYPAGRGPEELAGTFPRDAAPLDSDAFSPNTAVGACRTCHGLGRLHVVDESTLVADEDRSIRDGAIAAWPNGWARGNYRDILATLGLDVDVPFRELPPATRDWLLLTDEHPTVEVRPDRGEGYDGSYMGTYTSPRSWVLHAFGTTKSAAMRAKAAAFLSDELCPTCQGRRLNPDALAVTIAGENIATANALPLSHLAQFLESARTDLRTHALPTARRQAAEALIGGLLSHLGNLIGLGLGYLSVGRTTATLSGGELQRLHLATQMRSGLFGVLYVLDEPSAGLHPADTATLLTALERLRAAGNSVYVVEHNPQVIEAADWIVDLGPGAGRHGGEVLYNGPARDITTAEDSVTARYLVAHVPDAPRPAVTRTARGWLELRGVSGHNLREVDARFPVGVLTAVTGVSGSGKSTLVERALADTLRTHLHFTPAADEEEDVGDLGRGAAGPTEPDDDGAWAPNEDLVTVADANGLDQIDRLVSVDQKPIGRTPRSNLATYTGLFDSVRKLYAAQPEAKRRRFTASRFSFNMAAGRCPACLGDGVVSIEMLFLPTETAPCPVCEGGRYNPDTLTVTVKGRTIADVLSLTVEEAEAFFADLPPAARILTLLKDIGLGYLTLGQSATTLSGGEAQRIKLVSELHRAPKGHTLYLLDEPTSGLHPADVDRLVTQLQRLVDAGNTVVVVEHDLRTIAAADHLIDLGPGAGHEGGRIIATGTPEEVAGTSTPTARYLAPCLTRT
ncbi:ABC transporter [Streptomyces sp. NPDC059698]|uniref:excinuclease ABC subunit UvrA n=1 Tax=unclassified Streptomyces TaxID=2593676 RepID=UPI000938A657|nr:ABC transporter [Streptomyces sp. CB02366]